MLASDVITVVRRILNDEDEPLYRWTDVALVRYVDFAQRALKKSRPDLLYSGGAMTPATEVTATSTALAFDEDSLEALAHYVVAMGFTEDGDETGNESRAQKHLAFFAKLVDGGF